MSKHTISNFLDVLLQYLICCVLNVELHIVLIFYLYSIEWFHNTFCFLKELFIIFLLILFKWPSPNTEYFFLKCSNVSIIFFSMIQLFSLTFSRFGICFYFDVCFLSYFFCVSVLIFSALFVCFVKYIWYCSKHLNWLLSVSVSVASAWPIFDLFFVFTAFQGIFLNFAAGLILPLF